MRGGKMSRTCSGTKSVVTLMTAPISARGKKHDTSPVSRSRKRKDENRISQLEQAQARKNKDYEESDHILDLKRKLDITQEALEREQRKRVEMENRQQTLLKKLEIVANELARSRATMAVDSSSNTTVVEANDNYNDSTIKPSISINIPENYIKFYEFPQNVKTKQGESVQEWLKNFNRHPIVRHDKSYRAWVRQRTSTLFGDVISIFWKHSSQNYVHNADLLNCRLVNKHWKAGVDKFLQNEPGDSIDKPLIVTRISSSDNEMISKYLSDLLMAKTTGIGLEISNIHPFPSKYVVVVDSLGESSFDTDAFAKTMRIFAKLFGSDIDHLEYQVEVKDPRFDFSEYWPLVRKWFSKLPNLKTFTFTMPPWSNHDFSQILLQHLINHTFPNFENLVKFRAKNVTFPWIDALLLANPQLEEIDIYQEGQHPNASWKVCELPRLSSLTLNISTNEQLSAFASVPWELTKLTLTTLGDLDQPINLAKLFSVLENLQETLTDLTLKIKVDSYDESCDKLFLKLPKLRHLDISFLGHVGYISFDFLLPLTSLTTLNLSGRLQHSSRHDLLESKNIGEVIQLHGYLDKLYDSNIWSLFPKLKNVHAAIKNANDQGFTPARTKRK